MTIIDKPKFEKTSEGTTPELPRVDDPDANKVPSPAGTSSSSSASSDQNKETFSVDNPKKPLGSKRRLGSTEHLNDASDVREPVFISKKLKLLETSYRSFLPDTTKVDGDAKPTQAVRVTIKPMLGEPFTISIHDDSYVFELKEMIAERTGLTLSGVTLSLPGEGRVLESDEKSLAEAGIVDGTTLNLTVKVSSGVEPAVPPFEIDDFDDDSGEIVEFYEVCYPEDGSQGSETLADFVKQLEENSGDDGVETKQPISAGILSKFLDNLQQTSDIPIDELRISIPEDDVESERYHQELIKSALGPRGADIFQSPALTSAKEQQSEEVKDTKVVSSLTGASNCFKCGKKCKLAQKFLCKCGNTFCPQHRYYDQHNCTFDFKHKDRELVASANPKVVGAKIDKI